MASLQARHSRTCKVGRHWTTFAEATKQKGCTCVPLYHVVLRHDGKLVREPVGHNRKEAERASTPAAATSPAASTASSRTSGSTSGPTGGSPGLTGSRTRAASTASRRRRDTGVRQTRTS